MDHLIEQQIAYYRARASEYDEWFYRLGRYDRGEEMTRQWFTEVEQVRSALLDRERISHALDIASGTGIWTEQLIKLADTVVALDASPEVQAISQQKLRDARITYQLVDLFQWEPDESFDLVFAGFWLSHVPPDRLDAFLSKIARATRPGGCFFMVDSRNARLSSAANHQEPDTANHTHTRILNDGQTYQIVKVFYDPHDLEQALVRHGFSTRAYLTDNYFIYAEARMNDIKKLTQDRFGRYAQNYVTSQTHAKGAELDRLVEIAQPRADWHILDVATGGGHTALKFAPYVHQVIASDLTPTMLGKAQVFITEQGATNVEFRQADAESLPFDDATFDLVTCRIAPHHFPDVYKFVREAARVLKPGGLLLVQDQVVPEDERAAEYVNAFEKLRDPSHNRTLPASEWHGMFLDAELTIEHEEQIIKRHNFDTWTKAQDCPPEVIERLNILLKQAPPSAAEWLDAQAIATPEATFVNHHIIIAGRKLAS